MNSVYTALNIKNMILSFKDSQFHYKSERKKINSKNEKNCQRHLVALALSFAYAFIPFLRNKIFIFHKMRIKFYENFITFFFYTRENDELLCDGSGISWREKNNENCSFRDNLIKRKLKAFVRVSFCCLMLLNQNPGNQTRLRNSIRRKK